MKLLMHYKAVYPNQNWAQALLNKAHSEKLEHQISALGIEVTYLLEERSSSAWYLDLHCGLCFSARTELGPAHASADKQCEKEENQDNNRYSNGNIVNASVLQNVFLTQKIVQYC